MRKTYLFMMTSIDGFFEGPDHDLSWHNVDQEFDDFAAQQLDESDLILFGRKTYEMMAAFWPSQTAIESDPIIAEKMNSKPKIVVSTTLDKADWRNTRLVKDNVEGEIRELKRQPGKDIAVFGSSDLAFSLLRLGLLDELRIMVNPVVVGAGKRLFEGANEQLNLMLLSVSTFRSGNVLLTYRPA